jgi:hypothetical protein
MFFAMISLSLVSMALQSTTTIEQIVETGPSAQEAPETPETTAPESDAYWGPQQTAPSPETQNKTRFDQLSEGGESSSLDQLSKGDRNTESAPALSDKRQGRNTATAVVEGSDRCSAELLSAKDREYCQQVIENRSGEFAGPGPAKLSPEQKLMGERNFEFGSDSAEAAAKRLASGKISADDQNNQAIARALSTRTDK